MKYTIELTDKQRKRFKHMNKALIKMGMGFDILSLLEPIKTTNVENTSEYQIGYRVGYDMGLLKQSDPRFVPLQKCPVRLEDCKAYKLGLEDFEKLFIYEHDYEQFFEDTYGSKEPDYNLYDLVARYGAKKVVDDLKKWQEEKKKAEEESIKVGDVVKFNEKCHNYDHVKSREFLVLHIFDNGLVTLLYDNGDTGAAEISLLDKTGRHVDEVEQLLSKLKAN